MPSENNHIDNFIRNKASEAAGDVSGMDAGWQEMKELLVKPSSPPLKPGTRIVRLKRYLPYAAGLIMVVTTVTIMVLPAKKTAQKDQRSAMNKKTVPVKKENTTAYILPPQKVATNTNPAQTFDRSSTKKTPGNPITRSVKSDPLFLDNTVVKEKTFPSYKTIIPDSSKKEVLSNKTIFNNFFEALKQETQEFVIDTRHDTTLLCKEGSSLFIPSGAFQTLSGTAITGTVNISVQEYYSFADIISNKLSTTSNSMPLETGGMLYISAKAEEQDVMIRPNATLGLEMPTQKFNPEMQLFTGKKQELTLMDTIKAALPGAFNMQILSDTARITFDAVQRTSTAGVRRSVTNGINWEDAGQKQYFFNDLYKDITLFNVTDNPYETLNYKKGTKTLAKFRIPFDASISTSEMETLLTKKYGRYYDKIRVKREWGGLFNREKEKDVTKLAWYTSGFVGDSIVVSLKIARRLNLITREDSLAYEAQFLQRVEDAKKQKRSYEEFLQKRNDYRFNISNLGWINCDRFLSYPPSRLTNYEIHPGPGFEGTYFQAMMIFDKEKASMPGYWNNGMLSFPNLPVGHIVHLVCAGVKDGKMYSAVQTLEIRKKEKPRLHFEETSPQQFREKLARFGNVKNQ